MGHPTDQSPRDQTARPGLLARFPHGLFPWSRGEDENPLTYWREWILWLLYLAASLGGTVVSLATAPTLWRSGQTALLALGALTLVWCWVGLLRRRHLSRRLRSLAAVAIVFVIGLTTLVKVGPVSGGVLWLFTFAVLAGILLGLRAAALAIAANIAIFVILTWAMRGGRLAWPLLSPQMYDHWVVAGINALLLNTLTAVTVAALMRGMETALDREQVARRSLEIRTTQANQAGARLDSILRASPVGIGVVVNRVLTMANPQLCQVTGYTEAELVGRPARMLYPTQDEYDYMGREKYRQMDATGIGTVETRWRRKDGSLRHILLSSTPIDPDDLQAGVTFTALDISERLAAEAALRAGELRYRQLFDGIDDIIFTHDLEGRVITINRAVERIMGYEPAELVGRPFSDLMPSQYRQAYFDQYVSAVKEKGQVSGLTKYQGKDGRLHYVEYRSLLTQEEGGEPYVRGSAREVTERIMAERELRHLEGQLFQSQKMEALGLLAGGIAHDFNNVLQAIAGYVHLLLAGPDASPVARRHLHGISRYIERAAGMIKRLMTLARKVDTRLEKVDLNREVRHTAGILEHTLPKMIEIHLDLDPELPFISGDPGQIEQVLLNLATNAAQAMPDGGLLTFTTRSPELSPEQAKAWPGLSPGLQVRLEVSDTGLGMDVETISHIFEPFFTTKPLGEGTGLGLSTVYGIVANHGGQITCRSALREGSTFTIHLPSRHTLAAAPATAPFAPAPLLAGSETILVVDDEEAIRDSCREVLADQGYGVLLAASGEEALNLCRQRPGQVHLVILDLNMPGMGGFRCLEALLKLAPSPKVVIASGYRGEANARDLSDMGADGFMDKPYRLKEMIAKVREVLDR